MKKMGVLILVVFFGFLRGEANACDDPSPPRNLKTHPITYRELQEAIRTTFPPLPYDRNYDASQARQPLTPYASLFSLPDGLILYLIESLDPKTRATFRRVCRFLNPPTSSLFPNYLNNYCLTETRPHSMPLEILRRKVKCTPDGVFKLADLYSVTADDLEAWFDQDFLRGAVVQKRIPGILSQPRKKEFKTLYAIFKVAFAADYKRKEILDFLIFKWKNHHEDSARESCLPQVRLWLLLFPFVSDSRSPSSRYTGKYYNWHYCPDNRTFFSYGFHSDTLELLFLILCREREGYLPRLRLALIDQAMGAIVRERLVLEALLGKENYSYWVRQSSCTYAVENESKEARLRRIFRDELHLDRDFKGIYKFLYVPTVSPQDLFEWLGSAYVRQEVGNVCLYDLKKRIRSTDFAFRDQLSYSQERYSMSGDGSLESRRNSLF